MQVAMLPIESDFANDHESARECGRRLRVQELTLRDRACAWITCCALWAWLAVRLRTFNR